MIGISQWVLTFLLNGTWQIIAITALTLLCTKLLHQMPSRYAHRVWGLALTACLLVPLMAILVQVKSASGKEGVENTQPTSDQTTKPIPTGLSISLHSRSRSIVFPPVLMLALLWAYGALLFYRFARLGWAARRTSRLRQSAYPRAMPAALTRVAERCMQAFSLSGIPVLCSAEISGPATVGYRRPVLILPETFFTDAPSEDDLLSALSHEMAHVRRRDFIFNLLYEAICALLCFHPCVALMRARLAQTRELACDEMAARMLPSGAHYARSLLHIAQSLLSGEPSLPNYALGLFDSDTLEERIMNILNTNQKSRTWARALRLTAACLVGAVAISISAFSLRLAAESSHDQSQFAGTWETKYKGRTFFTLNLKMVNGVLAGTTVHCKSVGWVDGEIVPDSDDSITDPILETHSSGRKLMVKISNGPNDPDPISVELTLTGKDQADGRLIVDKSPNAPVQTKPWHFQRISGTP